MRFKHRAAAVPIEWFRDAAAPGCNGADLCAHVLVRGIDLVGLAEPLLTEPDQHRKSLASTSERLSPDTPSSPHCESFRLVCADPEMWRHVPFITATSWRHRTSAGNRPLVRCPVVYPNGQDHSGCQYNSRTGPARRPVRFRMGPLRLNVTTSGRRPWRTMKARSRCRALGTRRLEPPACSAGRPRGRIGQCGRRKRPVRRSSPARRLRYDAAAFSSSAALSSPGSPP